MGKLSLAPLLDLSSQHLNQMKCQFTRKVQMSVVHVRFFFYDPVSIKT